MFGCEKVRESPVDGLPSRRVLHLVALLTEDVDDGVVAQEVTCSSNSGGRTRIENNVSEPPPPPPALLRVGLGVCGRGGSWEKRSRR